MKKSRRLRNKSNRFSYALAILVVFGIGIIPVFASCYEKSWHFSWNEIRTQLKDTINIAEKGGIDDYRVGYANRKSMQHERQKWLMQNATTQELKKLIEYPSGTIKAIAYEGLLKDPLVKDKTAIVLSAMNDTSFGVYYSSGCIIEYMSIGTYLLRNVLSDHRIYYLDEIKFRSGFNFTKEQTQKMLSTYDKVLDKEN